MKPAEEPHCTSLFGALNKTSMFAKKANMVRRIALCNPAVPIVAFGNNREQWGVRSFGHVFSLRAKKG